MVGHRTETGRTRRPGAAISETDSESGTEALDSAEDMRRSLRALELMRKRGLISAAEFERRRAMVTTERADTNQGAPGSPTVRTQP